MPQSNPGPAQSQVTNLQPPASNFQLIETISVALTPVSVAAATAVEQSFGANGVTQVTPATGILAGDVLQVNAPAAATAVLAVHARTDPAVNDKFYIGYINPSAGALVPSAGTYKIQVFRPVPAQLVNPIAVVAVGN